MHRYQQFWAFAILFIATTHAQSYGSSQPSAPGSYASGNAAAADSVAAAVADGYQLLSGGSQNVADAASAAAASNDVDSNAPSSYGSNQNSYGCKQHVPYVKTQNVPYTTGNTKGNTVTSSLTYPENKGEILIHRPAPIIVKRPPTKVVVNHAPLVVKPAPVVLHKPPAIVLRKVYVKHHPRPVKVEPVYVNVVKPPAEKYFVNEKKHEQYASQGYAAAPAPASQGYAAAPAPASQGYAAAPAPASQSYVAPASQAYAAAPAPQQQQQAYGSEPESPASYSSSADSAAASAGYQLLQGNEGLAALANIAGGNSDYGAPSQAAPSLSYGQAAAAPAAAAASSAQY